MHFVACVNFDVELQKTPHQRLPPRRPAWRAQTGISGTGLGYIPQPGSGSGGNGGGFGNGAAGGGFGGISSGGNRHFSCSNTKSNAQIIWKPNPTQDLSPDLGFRQDGPQ
ncbi:hypothetical protein Tco_0980380, partial [Tanacetum coccineum]